MNKGRRYELMMLKFKQRIKRMNISEEKLNNPINNFFAFRSHGKPCSCWACRDEKYNRAKEKQNTRKQLEE